MIAKPQNTSVLIVEDDTALNDAYQMILGKSGYDVHSALNGQEALEKLQKLPNDPDIILLDLRMPVLDGIGFLKEFQPMQHPDTSVVVFTNYEMHKDIDEAYALGVERYVLKARTSPNDLLHIVESIVAEGVAA